MTNHVPWCMVDTNTAFQFLESMGRALHEPGVANCPSCERGELRFYFHWFARAERRGSLWVWCPACREWTHSRIRVEFEYDDVFAGLSLAEFAALERKDWLGTLDRMWTASEIPHSVRWPSGDCA